jgi:hypothetical protein
VILQHINSPKRQPIHSSDNSLQFGHTYQSIPSPATSSITPDTKDIYDTPPYAWKIIVLGINEEFSICGNSAPPLPLSQI